MGRTIAALFAAASAFPALIVALGLHQKLGGAFFVGALLFAGALGLGAPALALFCRRRWWGIGRCVGGGFVGGALCALPFAGNGTVRFAFLAGAFALAGAAVAVPFWFAAVWRNAALTRPQRFRLPCGTAYRYAHGALRRAAASRTAA